MIVVDFLLLVLPVWIMLLILGVTASVVHRLRSPKHGNRVFPNRFGRSIHAHDRLRLAEGRRR